MTSRSRSLVILAVVALAFPGTARLALSQAPPSSPSSLEKLVAPIALYPDALVAQILPASTKPIQVVEAARSIPRRRLRWRRIRRLPRSAYPAVYGSTGIMTFIVGLDGIVYQKDLGPQTQATASAMTAYDPDSTWKRVAG